MLNETIRALRQAARLTQVDLAKAMGVSKQCVSNWENDNIQPSVEMLVRLAQYFRVSTDFLLGLEKGEMIDAAELSAEEIAHVRLLVADLAAKGR